MAKVNSVNKLTITRIRDYGAHLDGGESGDILLRKKYVPENCRPGDEVEVFVYTDGPDRLRATTEIPYAAVGRFASLRVAANTVSGAFLDWGLEKDLLLPKKEQHGPMEKGGSYIVFVFLDEKTNRITASAKLEKFFSRMPPDYAEGQEVDLLVYDRTDMGFKAVVNNSHGGMIYKNEVFIKIDIGQQLKGYIKKIRADGKIDLSLQQPGFQKIDAISRAIFKTIQKHGGRMAVGDNSPPEEIYSLFGVSKKTFKKAVGTLYKKRLIAMDANGIRIVSSEVKNRKTGSRDKAGSRQSTVGGKSKLRGDIKRKN